jgi:hypothetical protein
MFNSIILLDIETLFSCVGLVINSINNILNCSNFKLAKITVESVMNIDYYNNNLEKIRFLYNKYYNININNNTKMPIYNSEVISILNNFSNYLNNI